MPSNDRAVAEASQSRSDDRAADRCSLDTNVSSELSADGPQAPSALAPHSVDQTIAKAAQDEVQRAVALALSAYATPATEFLNTAQAAKYLSLSEQYLEIARHKDDGSGPAYIKLPRAVRYRRADLDGWMELHRKGDIAASGRRRAR